MLRNLGFFLFDEFVIHIRQIYLTALNTTVVILYLKL